MTYDECQEGQIVRLTRVSRSVSAVGQLMKVIRYDADSAKCVFLSEDNNDPVYFEYTLANIEDSGTLYIDYDSLEVVM